MEIQSAVYGSTDSTALLDVTSLLQKAVKDNKLTLAVTSDALGKDPAVMHPKELRVKYMLDGKLHEATFAENGIASLPPLPSIGVAPQWEAQSNSVKLWSNADIEVKNQNGKTMAVSDRHLPVPSTVDGPWQITFPPNWGAPPAVTFDHLISWTDHTDAGVRYFSGTATYEKNIDIPADRFADNRELWLDLGQVKNLAEVIINGHNLGVLWKPPFQVNITSVAKAGANTAQIKITNLWPNRLIGDEQLPADVEWGERPSQILASMAA